jgi:hypothetical protein
MSAFGVPWVRRPTATRAPGEYTRALVMRLRMRCLLTLGLFAVFTGVVGRAFGLRHIAFEAAEVALLCACFAVTRWVLPVVERYDRGAAGEEYVGSLLSSLSRDSWRIIHDVELGMSNVDHIVVGPGGLFTVETKSHPGPIRVHNIHGRLIRQVLLQRRRVERLTGEEVEPLLVYSRARVDAPGRRRKGVRVLDARSLTEFLVSQPPRFDGAQVEAIFRRLLVDLED